MRIRIDCAYDGTGFSGWARQPGLRTVQGVLEATIAQVLRLDEVPATVCAGRTDAGVHARGQVVHLDLPDELPRCPAGIPAALTQWLPRALPDDVAVHRVSHVPHDFDARFSALTRRYVYRLCDSPTDIDPLTRGFIVSYRHQLDVEAMREASQPLIGLHDFVAFAKPREGATTIRTLLVLEPRRLPGWIEITVVADAFCHSMVRSLVGALTAVGRGQRDVAWMTSQLEADKRANDIVVMPAHGLTLEEVTYPPDEELALRAARARTRRDEGGS